MIILSIETSCDDTCVAVVEAEKRRYQRRKTQINFNILSNIVSSQVEIHRKWGGVYPALSKREHQKNLPLVLRKVLNKAKKSLPAGRQVKIDLIAVTVGPGLEPCLWVGINFAKSLAQKLNVPIVSVNHIEAHILANFVGETQSSKLKAQNFPAICLVVSGGHTQLILMRGIGKYKILGETRDDAAGECFDKTARILGLGYPGGPAIAREASFPSRPMLNQKNYDFSFSGLKTAVLYSFKNYSEGAKLPTGSLAPSGELSSLKRDLAKEIQQAIIDVLIKKTIKAAKDFRAKTVILGGGVAANSELRRQFKLKIKKLKLKISFLAPPKNLCTDNAVMTAIAGYYGWLKKGVKLPENIKAEANLRIK